MPFRPIGLLLCIAFVCAIPARDAVAEEAHQPEPIFRPVTVEPGREIRFVRMFSSMAQPDVQGSKTFCGWISNHLRRPGTVPGCRRTVTVLAGEETDGTAPGSLFSHPLGIVTDSTGRILVADPEGGAVHIFDLQTWKHSVISADPRTELKAPTGIAVDADDNIYVTDPKLGMIFVYDHLGRGSRVIGKINGENFYQSPAGIAIDRRTGNIYLCDTGRHMLFILDAKGKILKRLGKRGGGSEPGEFRSPTAVALDRNEFFVLDGRNRRIQAFDLQGNFQREFTIPGISGSRERPVSMGVDSHGNLFMFDGARIRVFSSDGRMLTRFGSTGTGAGQFDIAASVWIDDKDHLYVSDTSNKRVQIFDIVNTNTPQTTN